MNWSPQIPLAFAEKVRLPISRRLSESPTLIRVCYAFVAIASLQQIAEVEIVSRPSEPGPTWTKQMKVT